MSKMQQDLDPITTGGLMSPVSLQSTRSSTVLPDEERIRRKAEMAGILKQLEYAPFVKNPWAALFHETPLASRVLPPSSNSGSSAVAGNSKTKWFFDAFAQTIPVFGVAISFLKTSTQTAAVHLPNTSTVRKCFSESEQKRLCSEHFQRIAFPAVTTQIESYLPTNPPLTGTLTIEHQACPLTALMDQASDQFVCTSDERKQFTDTDAKQDILVWMQPIDRLKIIHYVLQQYPSLVTSADRLPPLALLLLLHSPAEERRQLAPRLKTDENFMHAIGGLVVGLPGFAPLDTTASSSSSSSMATNTDLLYGSGSPRLTPVAGSDSSVSSLAKIQLAETCPFLNPLSASALFFAFWSEYMRHQTVRLHHYDGLLMSVAAACISSIKQMNANRHQFDSARAPMLPRLFHLPRGVVTRAGDQQALVKVRSQNYTLARAIDGDTVVFAYVVAGMSMPDARFISAARRGSDYSTAERKASDGDAFMQSRLSPQKREWIRCNFKRLSIKKVISLLCRHGHFFKLSQLQQFQEAHRSTALAAVLIDDAHGSDVAASLERILRPDQFFIATFAQEDSKQTHVYSGIYSSIVVAPASAIWLYQRYAALRFYSPTNGVFNTKREEGVLTHRLPFAPTIMQLLESSDIHHQLAGISVLREWNGFKRLTPADWTTSMEQLATNVLQMINACLVCEQLPRDNWPFMCKLIGALIAFDPDENKASGASSTHPRMWWQPVSSSNPLARLTVQEGSSETFADTKEIITHQQLLRVMQPIIQSAKQQQPSLLLASLIEQLHTLHFEHKSGFLPGSSPIPADYKDTAYTAAALAVQTSTAFPQERLEWCKTGCILSHARCTALYGCIMHQEMKFFGYTDTDTTQVFETLIDKQQEESTAFTGLAHVCPATYEFGLALNRTTSGSAVASPSTRFYVWKTVAREELDVPLSFLLFQREFATSLTSDMLEAFNAITMRNMEAQAAVAVKKAIKRGLSGDSLSASAPSSSLSSPADSDHEGGSDAIQSSPTKRTRLDA